MKHTPGPWTFSHDLGEGYSVAKELGNNSGRLLPVALAYIGSKNLGTVISREEAKDNARLIAAAPVMYEALRFCEVELAPDGDKGNIELWQKVRAILAKIEGE